MSLTSLARPGRCVVMGVLNVTPDSFSDGGCFADTATAVAHGLDMHAAGADYVDIGGESTRPGADRVDSDEECIAVVKRYLSFFPSHCEEAPPVLPVSDPVDRMDEELLDVLNGAFAPQWTERFAPLLAGNGAHGSGE